MIVYLIILNEFYHIERTNYMIYILILDMENFLSNINLT